MFLAHSALSKPDAIVPLEVSLGGNACSILESDSLCELAYWFLVGSAPSSLKASLSVSMHLVSVV